MTTTITDFSAKEPSLGYFYQIKYALLVLLSHSKELDNPKVRIENLDDIEIEDINTLQLLQTKLHIKNKANLTDSSVDFWKTVRIWSEYINTGTIDLDSTIFNLITTEEIPESSVLHKFKKKITLDSEVLEVIKVLDRIAIESTNKTNEKAYLAYQSLSLENKKNLIKRIRILDNSIAITEINDKIKKELIFSTYPSTIDAFLEILEGWWFAKSIENLTSQIDSISSSELQLKIANISDSFQADNLPNHFPVQLEITDEDVESLKERNFLKQLELIKIKANSRTLKRAISDFRRAFEQRSKWLRLHLLNPDEEEQYDVKLFNYWKNIFDIMCDEAEEKSIEELIDLGKGFYVEQFAKSCPQIKIREKFNEDYLTRGSYQMLADSKKIGWHPNYKEDL
ncbi:ABC-three component system protein [Gillisia sp. Hel_I_29]|uniref:ABC-three component system protein n=1 Tax=Gillisia sp. Hel_I_29 TaxID=1249975 RepID=UPI00054DD600|nr:ABC-three component system protein [Gillisia sp. Hel_I_29]